MEYPGPFCQQNDLTKAKLLGDYEDIQPIIHLTNGVVLEVKTFFEKSNKGVGNLTCLLPKLDPQFTNANVNSVYSKMIRLCDVKRKLNSKKKVPGYKNVSELLTKSFEPPVAVCLHNQPASNHDESCTYSVKVTDSVKQECPAAVITDVGQPVTVIDTDQEKQSFSKVNQPRRSVKQTGMLTSQVRPSKRLSQVMKDYQKWRESAGSSVGDQELGLVTDRDFMAPNSKVAKSEANVMPHAVLQEVMIFPQSTQKDSRTLTVPNHQVAVMSNLLSMWKAGQLCDFYISNGTAKIMVHKMVLGAVCPKMLPVLNSSYSKVTLPSYISKEAMLAFAEYMYTGVLDLNKDILVQLKTIAQRLDMKDFEQLCSRELQKTKAASILSAVREPLLAEPCSLSGLLPSSTQRTTDPGHSQNTTFRPLLKPLGNVNSSNSQRVVPTDNLTTVGGPSSSSSLPTLRSAPATTTEGQVIDIKIELESDEETLSIPSPKMEPCSPVRDQYGISEDLLLDFENITSNTRVGLQLARPGMVSVPSNIATITDLFPTTSNSIPYPVGLFTSGGIKITPALQENCV